MHKKFMVLIMILLMMPLGRSVSAAENLGNIRIRLASTNGEVILYRVGEVVPGGYRLTDPYGGGLIQEEDADSVFLAQWLAEIEGEGISRILDADGYACFYRLEPGLYLVRHRDDLADEVVAPFLIQLPCHDQWDVDIDTTSGNPSTGQTRDLYVGVAGMHISTIGLICCLAEGKTRKKKGPQ